MQQAGCRDKKRGVKNTPAAISIIQD